MGGKRKQAQRTKNNARPSSSGRSAEQLGTAVPVPHFAGFIKETTFAVPSYSLIGMENMDSSVDASFQLVLKKMSKKDSTTKLKALQEFMGLVMDSDQEAVKTILVFWTRIYCVLATDTEHKVREATQLAHYQVVLKVKRNLAPFLKQLIGPWFTSQYDTYAPAASAAIKSIESAFPNNKTQEAIVFCQEEILNYIYKNLIVHTAQSLNFTNVPIDEAEAKYERVVISSLQGYCLYLDKVDREQIEKVKEINLKIVSDSAFWRIHKNAVVPIRTAWFNVLKSICQKVPDLLKDSANDVVNAVFQNLDENEPIVLFAVWEAALLVITTIENWWTYISIEKLVLPKLYKVLRDAAQGNATMVFPNLLPLLSNLPPNIDFEKFYCGFFEHLQTGLKLKSTLASRSESSVICVTFIECLQYVIMKNQTNLYLSEKLIKTQLLRLIEWGLIENQSVYKTLFNQVSNLVQCWQRNRNDDELKNYGKYLEYFWNNVASLFEGLLIDQVQRKEKNALSELALKQIEFLMSLKHHTSKPRKKQKVQFSESVPEGSEPASSNVKGEKFDEGYLESVNALVFKICKLYINMIDEKLSRELVEHLYAIMTEFDNEAFILKLNDGINRDGKLIDLYQNLLSKWLNSGYICTQSVVGLVFILIKYTGREEKLKILESFVTLPMEQFGWCLQSALSHPYNQDEVIHEWLSNSKVDEYLIKLAEDTIKSKSDSEASNLLKLAFTEGEHGELFLSNFTVQKIIELISGCLKSPLDHMHSLDNTCSFAAFLCSILYTENNKLKYGPDLLIEIFRLLCNEKYNKETITKDTLYEMHTSVYDSIEILGGVIDSEELKTLIRTLSVIMEKKLFEGNRLDVDSVYNLIVGLIKSVRTPDEEIYTAEILFEKDFVNEWRIKISEACVSAEYINGNLSSPSEKLSVSPDGIALEHALKFAEYLQLKVKVLATCPSRFKLVFEYDDAELISENNEGFEDEWDDEQVEFVDDEDVDDTLVIEGTSDDLDILCHLLYDYTITTNFMDNYKTTEIYDQLTEVTQTAFEHLSILTTKLSDVNEYLLNKIEQDPFWERTIYCYNVDFKNQSKSGTYKWYLDRSKLYNVPWKYRPEQTLPSYSLKPNTKLCFTDDLINFGMCWNSEQSDKVKEIFEKICEFRKSSGDGFYAINFAKWADLEVSVVILRLFNKIFANFNLNDLDDKYWDFVIVSVASWASKIRDIRVIYKNIQIQAFISNVCRLIYQIERYLNSPEHNPKRLKEWSDVFAEDVHIAFAEIWLFLTEQVLKDVQVKTTLLPFLQQVGNSISSINHIYVINSAEDKISWSKILKQCCALLVNQSTVLQLWGYEMLKVLKPGLVEIDSRTIKSNVPNENGLIFERLKNVLHKTQEIVHILLSAMKLGEDSCRVQPHTDSYTYTFAYTLIWDYLLLLCEASSTDLHFQYAEWLKNNNYLSKLLIHLFKLMPGEVLFYVPSESKIKPFYNYFNIKFELSMNDPLSSATLERMVCWVFTTTMSQLPASVRQWWTDREPKSGQIVERVTAAYVSPRLCSEELADVARRENNFRNMAVRVHATVREVVAVYTVDDVQMDLVIALPANYPLVGPDVQCNKQIAGASHRNWLMQLKKCFRYQNGRIWDGLSLWNNSLNKKFDGVEECYICFAVLHQGTYQLPKLSCQTCRKKFHSACLYKWFSTSNKSTCPICRNLF